MSALASALILVSLLGAAQPELSPEHELWLERDVVYIITDREREVFLMLESVDERDRFIDAFWRRRDPNPGTPVNEFRVEHYRRLDYANEHFGRETFREGWRTDRGRFYIILGEPRGIQRFDGYREIVSAHLWFYQGDPAWAVPSFFYLLFFKRNDIGEYTLYHPVIDGPQALLLGARGIPTTDNRAAIETLRGVSPELAAASLSLDPSDPADFGSGRASLGTDMMLARIVEGPKRAVRTDYADAGLRYGNRVSADYTFNFVASRSVFSVFAEPETRTPLVHYSVEIDPENFSLETDEEQSKFYTTLDLSLEARATDGTLVVASDKQAYIELTPSQVEEVKARAFAYQDGFALVPGSYTVSVIVRNRVSRQYTVAEADVHVPDAAGSAPLLTDVVLGFDVREGTADLFYTYEVGGSRIQPAAEGLFVIGDTVHVATQLVGASNGDSVVFELRQDAELVKSVESAPNGAIVVVEPIRLAGLIGGEYEIVARLVSGAGETLSTRSAPLTLSPRSFAPRPGFVYRRGLDTRIPGVLRFLEGEQLWNLGRFEEATRSFEAAVASGNEGLVPAKWKLANAYLRESRADEALSLLQTPRSRRFSDRFEVAAGIGLAMYMKDDFAAAAVVSGSRARAIASPDTMVLNALGDSLSESSVSFDEAPRSVRTLPSARRRPAGGERRDFEASGARRR